MKSPPIQRAEKEKGQRPLHANERNSNQPATPQTAPKDTAADTHSSTSSSISEPMKTASFTP